jgi:hypothetical protein
MQFVKRSVFLFSLVALGGLAGGACSVDTGEVEHVDSVAAELGTSCGEDPASKVVSGGFSAKYTTAATYSDCYKATVVEMDQYAEAYKAGGYTKVSWGDAIPSDETCTATTVTAYLFRQEGGVGSWKFVSKKSASGDLLNDDLPSDMVPPPAQPSPPRDGAVVVPKDPGLFGPGPVRKPLCVPPAVYFFGAETNYYKANYKIAATARAPNGTTTKKVSFQSVAGTCGQALGDPCCLGDGLECKLSLQCDSASETCEDCGDRGEACCSGKTCATGLDVCDNGLCKQCGGTNQVCCAGGGCLDAANTCTGGKCKPKPVAQPKPVDDGCGSPGEGCCNHYCDEGVVCVAGKCKTIPQELCVREGLAAQGQGYCCSGLSYVPATGRCAKNPNGNSKCDESNEYCCLDGLNYYCDTIYYKGLNCKVGRCVLD